MKATSTRILGFQQAVARQFVLLHDKLQFALLHDMVRGV